MRASHQTKELGEKRAAEKCRLNGENLARQRQRARSSFGDAKVLTLEMKSRLMLAKSRVEVEKKEVRGIRASPLWDIRGSHMNQHCSRPKKNEQERKSADKQRTRRRQADNKTRRDRMVAEEVVERIRAYQESCRDIEKEREKGALTAADYEEYNRQIDKTLRGLREQVQRQETALREVCHLCLADTVCLGLSDQ